MKTRITTCLRGIVLLLTAAAIMVFAASCGEAKYEPSAVVLEEDAEKFLTVCVEKADSGKGAFVFENRGEKRIEYGDGNYLEKQIDGEWMGLIQYNQREMTEPSYDLWPGESAEYETEWGDLEEGEYRYVVPFTVIEDEDEAPRQRYCTAARFTIQ